VLAETYDGPKSRDIGALHLCVVGGRESWTTKADRNREKLKSIKDDADRQVFHFTARRGGPFKSGWDLPGLCRNVLTRLAEWLRVYRSEVHAPTRQ